jgi:hypothetical protein
VHQDLITLSVYITMQLVLVLVVDAITATACRGVAVL